MYERLSLRANWNVVGHRFSNNSNSIDLPMFGVINLGASYGLENGLVFQANAFNVLDGHGLTEGNPRVDESLVGAGQHLPGAAHPAPDVHCRHPL